MAREARAPVSLIGLGLMGTALARAFLDAGYPTTVWNRSADKAQAVVGNGALIAATAADAVSASPLVIVCVRDYDAMHESLDAADLSGRVLVNLSTGSSQQGRETASWAAQRGAHYLDGAIMMTPPGIGQPETVILYGGPQAAFDAHEATLKVLGGGTTYLGTDPGLPSLYDVALLGIMWATLNGFLHALALIESEDIKATTFLPFATGWLTGVGSFLPGIAQQVDEGSYAADDATLETHLSPINHLIHESELRGIDIELPGYTRTLIERAIADGHATDSYARLIEHFKKVPGHQASRPEIGGNLS